MDHDTQCFDVFPIKYQPCTMADAPKASRPPKNWKLMKKGHVEHGDILKWHDGEYYWANATIGRTVTGLNVYRRPAYRMREALINRIYALTRELAMSKRELADVQFKLNRIKSMI